MLKILYSVLLYHYYITLHARSAIANRYLILCFYVNTCNFIFLNFQGIIEIVGAALVFRAK